MKRTIACVLLLILALSVPAMAAPSQAEKVVSVAMEQVGAPYKLHSNAPKSFNCVTFVAYCFNKVAPGTISSDGISVSYKKVSSIRSLKPGDIVGFKSTKRLKGIMGYHFGIYVGKGYFVHAANKTDGVIVSQLKDFKKRFAGAVRIL